MHQISDKKNNIPGFFHYVVVISLLLFPLSIIAIPSIHGIINLSLSLGGLWLYFSGRTQQQYREHWVTQSEKYFYIAVIFIVAVALFATAVNGFDGESAKKLGKLIYLLLCIPVYMFFRKVGVRESAFWYGLVFGAIASTGVALLGVMDMVDTRYHGRASGVTHPIIFGDLSLIMGAMSLAGIGWFRKKGALYVLLPVFAAAMGVVASFLSLSRGGWVAIPIIAITLLWHFKAKVSAWKLASAVVLLIAGLLVIYSIPQTGVNQKVSDTVKNISAYMHTDIDDPSHASSIGSRFEMWLASWQIFKQHPLTGVGIGNYQQHAQALVDKGMRHEVAAQYNHPHNQFLSFMAGAGILGLIATLGVFIVPIIIYYRAINKCRATPQQALLLAGFMMAMAFVVFNLSESFLERSRMVAFMVFYFPAILSVINSCEAEK